MNLFLFLILAATIYSIANYYTTLQKNKWKTPQREFPPIWRAILKEEVNFYNALNTEQKELFEYKVHEFLLNCRITGIRTDIEEIDRVLIAASAVIPIFGFKDWKYTNIKEVLVYPTSFNREFQTQGADRNILGMVGYGYMEGLMILSKEALKLGFDNETDKRNTAIHEFIHLIDKSDGKIDGIPSVLLEKEFTLPWIDLIQKKIDEIHEGESDINPYGGTNRAEFFSVASEYFFERPKLLQKKHPELYKQLESIFQQKMVSKKLKQHRKEIGRNEKCPCGSGLKFKHCCGKEHYTTS
ncbi:zinc-dependent peptidase [Wenyingzhuangia sp. IMCC45574]